MNICKTCKDCTERYIGCHGKCERYIAWCKEREAEREKIRKEKKKREDLDGFFVEKAERNKKFRRGKK